MLGNKTLNYSYTYDEDLDSKLNNVVLPNDLTQYIAYDYLGRTNEIKLGNHIKQFHYLSSGDHTSNLISSVWYGDNTKLNENYRYRYDEKGNIIEIKENGTLIARYLYDSLSRLIREDNKLLGFTTAFSYDNGGNIINKQMYNFTLNEKLDSETILSSIPYYYNSTGWRDQLVSYNGETFAYDELGNPTKYRDKNLTWSHGRLLKSFGSHTFQYNSNGIRIKKDNIKYFIDGNKIWSQTDGTNTMYFHYGIDGVIGFEYKDKEYTYKKNIQGDIIGIYNPENKLICKYIYDAWGNHDIYILNESNEISSYKTVDNSNNTEYTDICNLNPFRYRGYYYDTETDLYYLNTRYYDPELGRFINADALDNINMNLINGLNLYTYCSNNPMMFTDSKGSNWLSDLWNKTKKFFKENWDVIVGTITSIALVAGGLAVTIFSGGTLSWLGATMLGAGVGGFIGGLQSKLDGGSYWGGYLGGAISGGLTGLGASIGPMTALLSGSIGNFAGSLVTDAINGNFVNDKNYWLNLTGDSLISGLVSMGFYGFGNLFKVFNVSGFRELFIALTICVEFISSYVFDTSKTYIKDIMYYIHRYGIF